MMKKPRTVLVIEDDRSIVELVSLHLKDLGFDTESESEGSSGLKRALEHEYLLIVLDLMLPGIDGLEVCRRIRAVNARTPVLMLTAKSEELDKVLGLEIGADDYLTKPFSVKEFIARVKALARRASIAPGDEKEKRQEVMRFGGIVVDIGKRSASADGRPIDLTAKEFDLLLLFARNPGRAFNRQQLLDLVWGYQFDGYNHTVNTHINRLRAKIEKDPANPVYIQTVWGYGYRFNDQTDGVRDG
jgi:DNA-binding response OmpR family regulator